MSFPIPVPYDETVNHSFGGKKMEKVVFNMEPFTCPSCVKKIENTVKRVDGVEDVRVMFNSGRVRVEFDGARTDAESLQGTIERLGYPVLSRRLS